jgi:hypothetical protein
VLGWHQDIRDDDGLAQLGDPVLGRQFGGIVDVGHGAVREQHFVDDGRRAGDEVQIIFALEPLLDDVHVQQSQEPAAKSEPQRGRHFRLEVQRRVVQLELLESVPKLLVVV